MRLRILGVVVAALLLASIAANLYLYRSSSQYYYQLNATRLDPLGLSAYPAATMQAARSKPSVVVFGDSRAYAWKLPKVEIEYEEFNRGIGAQTTAQVLGRFDEHIAPLQPDIVVLQVGINDLKTIPLFPGEAEQIIARCKENIRQIVERARQLGAIVVLTTIFPHGAVSLERRFFWSEEVMLAVDEVNLYLATLARDEVLLFDTGIILRDATGHVQPDFQHDLLHLNEQGYAALNEQFISIFRKAFEKHQQIASR